MRIYYQRWPSCLKRLIAEFLVILLQTTRPLLGLFDTCRYTVSCGHFAQEMLTTLDLWPALVRIMRRLLACNRWGKLSRISD